jgi:hypothetical protein
MSEKKESMRAMAVGFGALVRRAVLGGLLAQAGAAAALEIARVQAEPPGLTPRP